ncbi:MAG: peptide chain release factor 1 [Patescibacteria group bacterium]
MAEMNYKLPLEQIIEQYNQLLERMGSVSETSEMIKLARQQKQMSEKFELAQDLIKLNHNLESAKEVIDAGGDSADDRELIEMAQAEISEIEPQIEANSSKLLSLLVPEDPRDDYNILLEIRAGAGGDESSLFAGEMLRMYGYLAEQIGAKLRVISTSLGTVGGYKEVIAEITGDQVYSWFKYEAGVHRVQRVPETEKQGRIHTSTVTVAVMPLIEKDNDFKLDPKEIEIIISTSQGAGGQSVNTTYSAVRMRHIPTGIEAQSQDERSQSQNREKCLQVLTSRVYDHLEQQRLEKESAERKEQVGSGDRSEKIRTYNFPQDRLTDHRYNTNWNQLPDVMNGKIYDILTEIRRMEGEKAIRALNEKE